MVIKAWLVDINKEKIYKTNIIINSGITRNFILLEIVFIFGIDTRIKVIFYKLLIINRETINTNRGIVNIKIKELIIEIFREYLKYIIIDIIFIE